MVGAKGENRLSLCCRVQCSAVQCSGGEKTLMECVWIEKFADSFRYQIRI